jgi:hypothetical protein
MRFGVPTGWGTQSRSEKTEGKPGLGERTSSRPLGFCSDSAWLETFGIGVVEALSFGKPVSRSSFSANRASQIADCAPVADAIADLYVSADPLRLPWFWCAA